MQIETEPQVPIIFEDDSVLVVNKPAGLLVHPTEHDPAAMSLTKLFKDKLAPNDPLRPGVVHRLDKDTSGVMVMAKTESALEYLQAQFKARKVTKVYEALVWGHLKHPEARLDLPVARSGKAPNHMMIHVSGKQSLSEYKVMASYKDFSLLQVRLLTGRTHQIRVQFAHLDHPVVGDVVYSKHSRPHGLERQFLHAKSLSLMLTSGEEKTFLAPLPEDLTNFLKSL